MILSDVEIIFETRGEENIVKILISKDIKCGKKVRFKYKTESGCLH
jgi:hypothetical protein